MAIYHKVIISELNNKINLLNEELTFERETIRTLEQMKIRLTALNDKLRIDNQNIVDRLYELHYENEKLKERIKELEDK